MKGNNYKVDIEIYVVFIMVIGISVFNAIYSSLNITKNEEVNNKIMAVDIPSLQALENMNLLVTRSEMYSTNWAYIVSNKEDKERLKKLQVTEYPELKNKIISLMSAWKDKENAESMSAIFLDFEQLLSYQKQVMEKLVYFDDYQDPMKKFSSEEIVESQIIPRTTQIISKLNNVITSKKNQADVLHLTMRASYRTLMWSVLGIAIMVVIVILLAAFYMSNNIIVPLMKLKNYILQMGTGEIPDVAITIKKNAVGLMTEAVRKLSESLKRTATFAHNIGEGNFKVEFQPLGPNDELGNALIQMRESLSTADTENNQRHWVATGLDRLGKVLRENTDDIEKLSDQIVNSLVRFLNVFNGAIYLLEENHFSKQTYIELKGSYAISENQQLKKRIESGQGLIGQAIRDGETVHLKNAGVDTIRIETGLSRVKPAHVIIVPLKNHGEIYGAIELTSLTEFIDHEIKFVENIGEAMGSAIASSMANTLTKNLLDETRKQAERLTAQEEELRQTNEEISNQSLLLQASEEELKQSNNELKEKAKLVEEQNERLEQARGALSIKVKELELNSKFKSEFLANMSHELRTPLNSVLILAKLLSENKNKTLSEKEIEYASVIHKSGNDLLTLINDVLDLSKIEAGKIELVLEKENVKQIRDDMQSLFCEVANQKKIDFSVELYSDVPEMIITDRLRLEQVIKNLLSNAFKFTDSGGSVILKVKRPDRFIKFNNTNLLKSNRVIEFSVTDSGIGIPLEKQQSIFEAFQQEDGSTSRKYGGTGLGLSISRMLVSLLGGEMQLVSEKGKGSTFSILLPMEHPQEILGAVPVIQAATHADEPSVIHTIQSPAEVADDRNELTKDDKILLIVEDDLSFAKVLVDFAHEKKYKAVVATQGDAGIQYAEQINPAAIILDMQLPILSGWTVLKQLKENPKLANVPVHIMSAMDRKELGLEMGATTYLRKPFDKRDLDSVFKDIEESIASGFKKLLIIEDERAQFEILKGLIQNKEKNLALSSAINKEDAFSLLAKESFDCIILNLTIGQGHLNGFEILDHIKKTERTASIPLIVYTGTAITQVEEEKLRVYTNSVVLQGEETMNRILDETALFLHQVEKTTLSNVKHGLPQRMNESLIGKSILVADDDMRNIYALTNVLEGQGMKVITASNGQEALAKMESNNQIDIVLMDMMMPEMDGYTAIQKLRAQEKYKLLPIIVQTAKAMTGDRERCIQAGASDYITKPINIDQMLSLIHVWLYDK